MAFIATSASLQRACSSHHVIKKQQSMVRPRCSFETKQATHVITMDVESKKNIKLREQEEKTIVHNNGLTGIKGETIQMMDTSVPRFCDERWKNGTWDLNMFVKDGKMDWDGVIVAEARRRKFLEMYPDAATNQAPVIFRSSIIPWWAWFVKAYLPEAELLNGRAAMVGFFMAYFLDVLTGLDVVGQTGNFICKAGLFMTVTGIILFRRPQDFGNLKKLVNEATFYDKQWLATWKDKKDINVSLKQDKKTN